MAIAELLGLGIELYAVAGLVFAIAFVMFGVSKVDSGARGSTIGFRLVILPGVAALWPWMAYRWIARSKPAPVERNRHRDLARREAAP